MRKQKRFQQDFPPKAHIFFRFLQIPHFSLHACELLLPPPGCITKRMQVPVCRVRHVRSEADVVNRYHTLCILPRRQRHGLAVSTDPDQAVFECDPKTTVLLTRDEIRDQRIVICHTASITELQAPAYGDFFVCIGAYYCISKQINES